MNKEIKDYSLIELKALAFDLIASGEQNQRNIQAINQEIARRVNKPKIDPKTVKGTEEPKVEEPKKK